ncbi:hypothetical protein ACFVJI_31830 [Streptomyces sp. NPDC127584]|uniref:hypothetical protein n=1 Tax=Streptomyces sp. NPDC127584 TaxID=3345403 RepID=UPI00363BF11C
MGVSFYSSGGGGTVLEHRYAAVLLSALLTGSALDELGDALIEPEQIRLQARFLTRVDDIMIIGRRRGGTEEFTACIGVRRNPSFVPSDSATVKLVGTYLTEITEHWGEIESGYRRLVLAVVERSPHAVQVASLTSLARGKGPDAFRQDVSRSGPANAELRDRLAMFDQVVAEAAARICLDNGTVDTAELSWRLLSNLRIKRLRLEDGDEQDRSHAIDRLRAVAFEDTLEGAEAVFSNIEHNVGDWVPSGAWISKNMLRRELAPRLKQRFSAIPVQQQQQRPLEPDAVTRGPVAHLGLDRDFEQARLLETTQPAESAARYEALAQALDDAGWPLFALSMRQRQASVLHKAGDHDAGTLIDVSVMAAALEAGEPGLANSVIHRLSDEQTEAADHLIRSANALGDLAAFEHYHHVSLTSVTTSMDALHPQCPHAVLTAAWFAEHAVAQGRLDLIHDRKDVLRTLADSAAESESLFQVRLYACLADTDRTGAAWKELTRSSYPPPITALLRARQARFLAETGHGHQALERYEEAIERAVRRGNHLDAAAWIEAQSLVRIRYHLQTDELSQAFPTTTVLRAAGQGSVMGITAAVRERTLGRLANRVHSAERRQALTQYLRHSVASANWSAEREAHELLGRLHLEHKLFSQAADHFIKAGNGKLLKELRSRLPEEPFDLPVPRDWADLPRWKRKNIFLSALIAADLMPDPQARAWADLAMQEISGLATVQPDLPYVHEEAGGLLAAAAPAFTTEQARRFLDLTEQWHATGTTSDPRVGGPYARIVLAIARHHSGPERAEAVDRACQAMLTDYTMSQTILTAGDVLKLLPSVVAERCSAAAGRGGVVAALALVLAGAPADEARPLARSLLHATLRKAGAPPPPAAATLPRTAVLAAHLLTPSDCDTLAEALDRHARDHTDTAHLRQDALYALKSLAAKLTPQRRSQFLTTAMDALTGLLDDDADDHNTIHPYERFRFDSAPSTLRYAGLSAACRLAHTPAQQDTIKTAALPLLAHHDNDVDHHITRDLDTLPRESLVPLIPSLSGHPSPWVRALAARLWCHATDRPDLTGFGHQFARDPALTVRHTLARFLPDTLPYSAIQATLRQDCRRTVRLEASASLHRRR